MTKPSPFAFDPERPLEQCPGESARCNAALHDYAFMGPGRSLRKLCEQYKQRATQSIKPPSARLPTLMNWSMEFAWVARVATWQKQIDAEIELKWAERREQQRIEEWKLRDELLKLVHAQLAEGPKFLKSKRRVIKETGQEIITLAFDNTFLSKNIELVVKLGRLAANMETERQAHEVNIVDVSADELAKARDKAKAFEDEMLREEPQPPDEGEDDADMEAGTDENE
ncbi:MAG: hypothetical protein ACOYYS_19800 [Chloroflexota bacterium]